MKITLQFSGIKPLSLNQVFATDFKTKRRFKSKEYKAYESKINSQLVKYKKELGKINKYFNEDEHYLSVDYRFYYPIMTKKNRISKTSKDVSNLVKPIEDIIFKNLLADDSQITSTNVSKTHSEVEKIIVNIYVKSLNLIS